MKRIPRGQIPWFQLFSFIDVYVVSKENWPGPIIPVSIIPTFDGRLDVHRGPQSSKQISTIFQRLTYLLPVGGRLATLRIFSSKSPVAT